jgi:ABC-type nitrate/sulfonate/bicarbonate transport system ATPase subunit
MSWLSIEKLSYAYSQGASVIENLSYTGASRGVYLCHGRSGVGKTTLALLLAGHLAPTTGRIALADRTIVGPSRRVFLVSQEDDLFPWLRVREQVEFFQAFSQEKVISVEEALSWVELQDLEKFPGELSGGMRKRLSLLRATLLQPELLILDETLSSVEIHLRAKILNRLYPIWQRSNTGVLIISHDPLPELDFPLAGTICF